MVERGGTWRKRGAKVMEQILQSRCAVTQKWCLNWCEGGAKVLQRYRNSDVTVVERSTIDSGPALFDLGPAMV